MMADDSTPHRSLKRSGPTPGGRAPADKKQATGSSVACDDTRADSPVGPSLVIANLPLAVATVCHYEQSAASAQATRRDPAAARHQACSVAIGVPEGLMTISGPGWREIQRRHTRWQARLRTALASVGAATLRATNNLTRLGVFETLLYIVSRLPAPVCTSPLLASMPPACCAYTLKSIAHAVCVTAQALA
jgi:hypothetical protein